MERQLEFGAATHCRQAGSAEHEVACSEHLENAHSWQAGLIGLPASRGGGDDWHCPEVHAQEVAPHEPPIGPVDDPRQQRPAHQPHAERPVQAAQPVASEHSSTGVTVPLSTVGVPASRGVVTHAAYAPYCAWHAAKGNVVDAEHEGVAVWVHA